ncbi:MAG: flagellar biosynthetic protein FliO [Roseburia sp.]
MILLSNSSFESFLELIGVLIIFVFILVITYYTTKWIGNYQKAHQTSKNLKIVETLRLTNTKYIQIVQAGTEYLVIAVGKDEINLLAHLTKEQMTELPELVNQEETMTQDSFQEILNKVKEHFPKK